MEHRVHEYLAYRQQLGLDVGGLGCLVRIARQVDSSGYRGPVTMKHALEWAKPPTQGHSVAWARRLSLIRGFAKYEAISDPATEIPPMSMLGVHIRRMPPHIYTDGEVRDVLRAAAKLRVFGGGLAPHTFVTLFGLLASTGLRISEALHLTLNDVDLVAGVLTIRKTKFKKSRLVPIHPTVIKALRRYIDRRNAAFANAITDRMFLTSFGSFLSQEWAYKIFRQIRSKLGWARGAENRRFPRLHDFRHTFAVRRLMRWYEEGADVDQKIPSLATYLGHSDVSGTYWYLSATPELLAISGRRFERFAYSVPKGLE